MPCSFRTSKFPCRVKTGISGGTPVFSRTLSVCVPVFPMPMPQTARTR